ncbi:MAG: preprotein translocase subunit TatA [Nostocoides sp.]
MDFFGLNGWEMIFLAFLAVLLLGDRMPEYAAKLARFIRAARVMAEGAKTQLKDQIGPEYEDINWRQYDPRQYDPRRIVRQALLDPLEEAFNGTTTADDAVDGPADTGIPTGSWDPHRPTPYDVDAT